MMNNKSVTERLSELKAEIRDLATEAEARRTAAREAGDKEAVFGALSDAQRLYAAAALIDGSCDDAEIHINNARETANRAVVAREARISGGAR